MSSRIALLSTLVCLAMSTAVFAQDNNDATDVWLTVEAQWDAEQQNKKKWADEMLSDKFVGWGKNSPAPRNKESTKMWDRFNDEQGKTVQHELYPLSIIVDGDVAIAHYLYTSAYEDKEGKVEVNNGRFTDVLIRTEDGWKFIAWHGGDDGE